jgi:Pyruvate-formate lyase
MSSCNLQKLKTEMETTIKPSHKNITHYLLYKGLSEHFDKSAADAKAYATAYVFKNHKKHIYENDLIVGSIIGKFDIENKISENELNYAGYIVGNYGVRSFTTNADHFAPDFETPLKIGIGGIIEKIKTSMNTNKSAKQLTFLNNALITMEAFSEMIRQYGEAAKSHSKPEITEICERISLQKPDTFREALQLVWLIHVSFLYENRYAMALGRMDQYLYPFYKRDIDNGILTNEEAIEFISCTLYKIYEQHLFTGGDDVVNIAVGGVKRDGSNADNELTIAILEAVKRCNVPGPNLSARIHSGSSEIYWDKCLEVIGTGLGYPALMNDEVNIKALARHGYAIEDCNDYCMVGCIENFLPGLQSPWSDGRYNSPKYIELAFNNGINVLNGTREGIETGDISEFKTMEEVISAVKKQMEFGAAKYVALFKNDNERFNKKNYSQPYLSCYCNDCIEKGLDINDGGSRYPSVHGAGCMGIATVADSLAAIEKVVFIDNFASLTTLRDALLTDFEGYDELYHRLINSPKYGNDDDFVDKYAVWYVDTHEELFSKYRTWDGGAFYTAIASNVSNIPAGAEIAATPDGRKSRMPVSDAASPAHGMDKNGPTAVIKSISKPDYTKVACGTVLNQKYSPSMFSEIENREKIKALIKVYFKRGGQEIQINSVSREVLRDAMVNPGNYKNLVTRVSGFSAVYVSLSKSVQHDILMRTEH